MVSFVAMCFGKLVSFRLDEGVIYHSSNTYKDMLLACLHSILELVQAELVCLHCATFWFALETVQFAIYVDSVWIVILTSPGWNFQCDRISVGVQTQFPEEFVDQWESRTKKCSAISAGIIIGKILRAVTNI